MMYDHPLWLLLFAFSIIPCIQDPLSSPYIATVDPIEKKQKGPYEYHCP